MTPGLLFLYVILAALGLAIGIVIVGASVLLVWFARRALVGLVVPRNRNINE